LKKAVVIIDTLAAANKIGFTTQDFVQIYNHGILTILEQLGFFKIFPNKISKTSFFKDGILKLSDEDFKIKQLISTIIKCNSR
jgi:hypothetical protein